MTKIVINQCFGGYELSKAAYEFLGLPWNGFGDAFDRDRTNPDLVRCVETLGSAASENADLKVVEIPDDVEWQIDDYDGSESIHEVHSHRSWP
jgi:hypothetical protein